MQNAECRHKLHTRKPGWESNRQPTKLNNTKTKKVHLKQKEANKKRRFTSTFFFSPNYLLLVAVKSSHTDQWFPVFQVHVTGGGFVYITGTFVSEPRGDGGGFEYSAGRRVWVLVAVVVVRLEVLVAHVHLADHVGRSVYVHVEGKQPEPASLRVERWEAVKRETPACFTVTGFNATL